MDRVEMTRRSVLTTAVVGGSVVFLTACGQNSSTPGGGPASGAGIRFKDQQGRTITFDQPVTSVVTIPMPAASLLVAVDRTADHLAAMHSVSWAAMRDGIMGDMFPNALEVPHNIARNDFTPNVESILALNPDVVIQWEDSLLTKPLENAGLKVIGLTNTGTQEGVDAWTEIFAAMLGKPKRAEQMKARAAKELEEVKATASGRTGQGPSILYFNRFDGGLIVAGEETYNDFYIKLVGGTNPATGANGIAAPGMVGVDVEQVLAWDPEVILLGNFDAAMPDDIYSDPVWADISAVRSNRVYKVPLGGYRWDPPGQESPLMWNWLTNIAFPENTSDLRAMVSDYFDFLYAHQTTPAEIDEILWTTANGQSANYQQFNAS
ncbi:ABC transporter substrate-binding protein [Arthrobacter sp. H14]|uniref:ABC transporter substrate-binding protein n=1 Tax=Arthrobacter sp. H14 TaxID=1312959 RepID=UPI00047C32D0|nr:ABC transporter substrate-binding protein [Arthrobacter sp. H14]